MRKGWWIPLVVMLLVLPGATARADCLDTDTIAQGPMSGIETDFGCEVNCSGRDIVIQDNDTWAKIWALNWANFNPPPPLPYVNFREQIVLGSVLGRRPSTGYGVDIDCVSGTGLTTFGSAALTVTVIDTSPGPNCIVQPALTNPFHFVKLDRPRGPFSGARLVVNFEHVDNVLSCGDDGTICRECPDGGIGDIGQNQEVVQISVPCCP